MSATGNLCETISLSDDGDNDNFNITDIRHIDAEIIDYGVLEEGDDDEESSEPIHLSVNTPKISSHDVDKHVLIKTVDCVKYPWYYGKYQTQILNGIGTKSKTLTLPMRESDKCFSGNLKGSNKDDDSFNSTTLVNSPKSKIVSKINIYDREESLIRAKENLQKNKKRFKEDMEILNAIKQRNSSEVDFQRNKGLIGVKIKQKIINEPTNELEDKTNIKISGNCKKSKEQASKALKDINKKSPNTNIIIKTFVYNHKETNNLKATEENTRNITVENDTGGISLENYDELKCKQQTENNLEDEKYVSKCEKQQGIYNSLELTQSIINEIKKMCPLSLKKKNIIQNQSNDNDKFSEALNIDTTISHSIKLKNKKIELEKQNKEQHKTDEVKNKNLKKPAKDSKKPNDINQKLNIKTIKMDQKLKIDQQLIVAQKVSMDQKLNINQKQNMAQKLNMEQKLDQKLSIDQNLPMKQKLNTTHNPNIDKKLNTDLNLNMTQKLNINQELNMDEKQNEAHKVNMEQKLNTAINHRNVLNRSFNRKYYDNVIIPDVIKDCDRVETVEHNRSTGPALNNSNYNTTNAIIQSDFTVPDHIILTTDKRQDFPKITTYQTKPVLLASNETNRLKDSRPCSDQTLLNYNTINENSYNKMPNPNFTSFNERMNNLVQGPKDAAPLSKRNIKRKQLLSVSKSDIICVDDYLKTNLIFKTSPTIPSNLEPPNLPRDKQLIQTIFTDRNNQANRNPTDRNNRGNRNPTCQKVISNHIIRQAQLSANVARPYKVVKNTIRPVSSVYHRPDFQANIIRPPMVRPPFANTVTHQMPLQQFQSPRYGFQTNFSPLNHISSAETSKNTPYGINEMQKAQLPSHRFETNYAPYTMPAEPPRTAPINMPTQNSMQSFSGWNVRIPNSVNVPPGICDVHPNLNFNYPPPPVPPPPPPTTPSHNGSIIGRNNEGVVKKINLTPSKLQALEMNQIPKQKTTVSTPTSSLTSKNEMMEELQRENIVESSKRDQKRPPAQDKNTQETTRYRPGPLSKKLKQNLATSENPDKNSASGPSDGNCAKVVPKSSNNYSAPILPIPTYDIMLPKTPNKQKSLKPRNLGISNPKKGLTSQMKLKNNLADLRKAINAKKISLAEYKRRSILDRKNENDDVLYSPRNITL